MAAPLIPIGVTEYGCHWRTHIQDKITNTAGVHMYRMRSQNTCAVGVHMCRTGSWSSGEEACTRIVQVQLTHTCLGQGPGVKVAGVLMFTTGSQSTGAPGVHNSCLGQIPEVNVQLADLRERQGNKVLAYFIYDRVTVHGYTRRIHV
jgi:hypothetical protein